MTKEAVEAAARMTHAGFLTLPDRSMFPKIVGAKGANVARLRNETGADITVSRDSKWLVIAIHKSSSFAFSVIIVHPIRHHIILRT